MAKRPRLNNEILAPELRLIDEKGKNLGVVKLSEALRMASEKEVDLIEVSPKAQPPIAKIMDFGKYFYKERKKEKEASKKSQELEMKNVRIHLGTSEHDLALKAKKGSEFLKAGHRLKLELFLKGREKYLDRTFLNERLSRILNLVSEKYKILSEAKSGPRGMFVIIERIK